MGLWDFLTFLQHYILPPYWIGFIAFKMDEWMNVTGVVDRGAPRKMWRSCVKKDMKVMGIKEEMAQDRCVLEEYY